MFPAASKHSARYSHGMLLSFETKARSLGALRAWSVALTLCRRRKGGCAMQCVGLNKLLKCLMRETSVCVSEMLAPRNGLSFSRKPGKN